jgi:hypothetical protein
MDANQRKLLSWGATVLMAIVTASCAHHSNDDWGVIKEHAKTWKPVLTRHAAPGVFASRTPTRLRAFSNIARMEKQGAEQPTLAEGQQPVAGPDNDRPKLLTPDFDSPEARLEEARNQARERAIDRLIKFGICRGCYTGPTSTRSNLDRPPQ